MTTVKQVCRVLNLTAEEITLPANMPVAKISYRQSLLRQYPSLEQWRNAR